MKSLLFLNPLAKFISLFSLLFVPTSSRFTEESDEPLAIHQMARLPQDVVPIWYNLTLVTYVPGFIQFAEEKNQTLNGHLTIKVHVLQVTNKIELHAKNLTVPILGTEVFVDPYEQVDHSGNSTENGTIKVTSVDINNGLERVVIKLNSSLIEGKDYFVRFHYSGKILDDEQGFYYSSYTAKSDGKQRFLASTHMEPNSARYMVPCFDEPHLKAVWRLTVVHPKGTNAIFNAIETGLKQKDENWIETTFDETPVMSSYLLALVVSDYSYHESYVKSFNGQNIRFRVYANENGLHKIDLALEAGVKALTFYEKHFGISFPIPKMDMISVPRFSAGAMENWGLVTFRESALLYSETSSVSAKHWVAEVIAHELTHQWFGDLVTLNWWDDLFLNEGFATYFSSLGAVQTVKDYDIEGSFLYNMQNAFAYDSHKDSPPLSPHSGFDGIAYDKGASILRMIEMVMGPENFIHGIRRYLNKHQFTNTKHIHLLNALHAGIPPSESNAVANTSKGSPISIVDFGKAWIETPGHPLVSVTRLDTSRVKLTQKRFYSNGHTPSNASTWPIPIWYSVNNVTQKLTWLHDVLVLENIKETDLLTINEKSHGYYRVKYRGDLMQKIRQRLLIKHSDFSPLARARIIDDAFSLANADRLNYDSALNLVFYEEDHKLPKALVHKHLISILDYFDESEDPKTVEYIRQLSKGFSGGNDREFVFRAPPYRGKSHISFDQWKLEKRLTEEHEKEMQKDSPSKDVIIAEFKKHLLDACQKNPEKMSSECNTLPESEHLSLYCDGIKYARDVEFDYVFELFKKEINPDEKKALLESLTCTQNKEKIRHLLDVAADAKNPLLKLREREIIFDKLSSSNSAGKSIYFDYMKDNWQTLYSGFKNTKVFLKEVVRSGLANYPSKGSMQQLEEFVEKNVPKSEPIRATFDEAIRSLKARRQWIKKNSKPVANWFAAKAQSLALK